MTLNEIASLALDEVIAMDGDENAVRESGWLQAHDDRFHNPNHEEHGRFDPETMTCGLRQKLESSDQGDRLEGNGVSLASIPTRRQFNEMLDGLARSGLIDDEIRDDINRMVRSAEMMLERGDEDGFEMTGEDRDNLMALAEVYNALHAIETPDNNTGETPAVETEPAAEGGNGTPEPLSREEIFRYLNEFVTSPENQRRGRAGLRSWNLQWLERNYDRSPDTLKGHVLQRMKDIRDHFGPTHPMTRESERMLAAEVAEFARRRGDNAENQWPPFSASNLQSRFRIPHGELTREQVTPQLVDNITERLPRSMFGRHDYGTEFSVNQLMNKPERYEQLINSMSESSNAAVKALYECVKAVHPGLTERLAEERRRRDEERQRHMEEYQARQAANTISAIGNQAVNNEFANQITAEEIDEARARLLERYPNNDIQITRGLEGIRNGAIPNESQMTALRDALGGNSALMTKLMDRLSSSERMRQAAVSFRIPTSTELAAANDEVMGSAGMHRDPNGLDSVTVSGSCNGLVCYATTQTIRARLLGYKVNTYRESGGYNGRNRENFLKSRGAMAAAGFETTNRGSRTEIANNLERIRETYPDGTFLDNWTGGEGHGTGAILVDKKWYFFDGYGGRYHVPKTSSEIAEYIKCYYPGAVINASMAKDSTIGRQIISQARNSVRENPRFADRTFTEDELYDRGRRQLIALARKATPIGERQNFTDDQYMRKGYEMTSAGANMSFVITPDKPLLKETTRIMVPSER